MADDALRWSDDLGREVVIDPQVPPGLEDEGARLRATLTGAHFTLPALSKEKRRGRRKRELLAWVGILLVGGFWIAFAGGQLLTAAGLPVWAFVPVACLAVVVLRRLGRRSMGESTRRSIIFNIIPHWLSRGHCASCGYQISALRPEADGVRVCTECGAGWNLQKWAREFPAWFRPPGASSLRVRGRKITDARLVRVTLLGSRSRAEVDTLVRTGLVRALTIETVIIASLAILLALSPIVIARVSMWNSDLAGFALSLLLSAPLFVVAVAVMWKASANTIAAGLISRDRCPHCEEPLDTGLAADGARVCSACGSAWSNRSQVS